MLPKLLIILLFLISLKSPGQSQTISWTDTLLHKGDKIIIKPHMPLEAVPVLFPQENKALFDTLYGFLQKNSNIKVEFKTHLAVFYKMDSAYSIRWSSRIAEMVKTDMVKRGIKEDRMATSGLGQTQPIVPRTVLLTIKDETQRMTEDWKNFRVEIVVIAVE